MSVEYEKMSNMKKCQMSDECAIVWVRGRSSNTAFKQIVMVGQYSIGWH